MEIRNLCALREIYQAIREFETAFQQEHGLGLNEGMLLCLLKSRAYTPTEIADALGLTPSNTSKVIRSIEEKGLIARSLGQADRRQMLFTLTPSGTERLNRIGCECRNDPANEILQRMQQPRNKNK